MKSEIKISIRQPHYGSVHITLSNIPQEWGWTWATDERYPYEAERWQPTAALKAMCRELDALANAYNYDNSEVETDYFDRRYYLSVDAVEPGGTYGTSIAYRR